MTDKTKRLEKSIVKESHEKIKNHLEGELKSIHETMEWLKDREYVLMSRLSKIEMNLRKENAKKI